MAKLKEKNQSTGRFAIPPCCGPNHPHEDFVAAEVKLSPKGNYFFTCGICVQNYFLKYWDPGMGYTVADVEQLGMRTHLPRGRRLALLKELGLAPTSMAPLQPPPMPTRAALPPPPGRQRAAPHKR
jgi:hypothetical protein